MLTEFSVPPIAPEPTTGCTVDHLIEHARNSPERILLSVPRGSEWAGITAAAFYADVRAIAKGLIAAGIQPGDRIGIMSRTRYEWTLVDYATWHAGAINVPVYETSSAEQVQWILSNSGAVGAFVENDKHADTVSSVHGSLPGYRVTWTFDGGDLADLRTQGESVSDAELDARLATVSPDSIATIIYTSGTTGRPKGCKLTHKNFMTEVDSVVRGLPEVFLSPNSSTLLFLPIAHVFGRVIQLGCIRAGVLMGHCPDTRNLLADLATAKPTFVLAVPRVFEKVYNSAQQKATESGKGSIFAKASDVAVQYSQALDNGGPSLLLRAKHTLFDKLLYGKIRHLLGGNVEWALSGGAPLGERLGHFYRGMGVTILEGYGLTETTAATTVNRPAAIEVGSVGQPIPGAAVKRAEDGELLLWGPQIFAGYWENDAATNEALEPDGWFHSGDIGEIDDRGFVRITGRKKEILVTAGGKNVAPAVLEDRLRSNFLVSQCMVVGDGKPFIAALVTIDPEAFPAWLKSAGKPAESTVASMVDDPDLNAEISKAVAEANKAVSHAEAIKKFKILGTDWTEEGGQITPSLKLKRQVVMEEFAVDVASLYASSSSD